MSSSSSTSSSHSSSSAHSHHSIDRRNVAPADSKLLAKILSVVSFILLLAPCGLVMAPNGFIYAVACFGLGVVFAVFSSYLLYKK